MRVLLIEKRFFLFFELVRIVLEQVVFVLLVKTENEFTDTIGIFPPDFVGCLVLIKMRRKAPFLQGWGYKARLPTSRKCWRRTTANFRGMISLT